jgi:hypothetical protein
MMRNLMFAFECMLIVLTVYSLVYISTLLNGCGVRVDITGGTNTTVLVSQHGDSPAIAGGDATSRKQANTVAPTPWLAKLEHAVLILAVGFIGVIIVISIVTKQTPWSLIGSLLRILSL